MAKFIGVVEAALDFMTFIDFVRYANFSEIHHATEDELEEIRQAFVNR